MPRNNKPVSLSATKAIFHEAASACPFCGDTTLVALQIHHIHPRADGGSNHRSNLILCCASCHDKIEGQVITLSDVLRAKYELAAGRLPRRRSMEMPPLPNNVVNFRGSNSAVVAGHIDRVMISSPRRPRIQPPSDVLAADADRRSYVKYLIDRYHEFKKAEVHGSMKYEVLYASIKRKFGCKWDFVPLGRFLDIVAYVQHRIDGTILGRNRRANGQRSYSSFHDYLDGKRYAE